MLLWYWVLIGWINRKRYGLGYAECFAGSGCQSGRPGLEHPVMTALAGLGVTSTSKKTRPPFHQTVQNPVSRIPHDFTPTAGRENLTDPRK